jgi:ribosomal protein S18 acetylase RimI-like enzyme
MSQVVLVIHGQKYQKSLPHAVFRQLGGRGTSSRAAVRASLTPLSLEVLVGNEAALALYLSEGFRIVDRVSGKLAGNERFAATAYDVPVFRRTHV